MKTSPNVACFFDGGAGAVRGGRTLHLEVERRSTQRLQMCDIVRKGVSPEFRIDNRCARLESLWGRRHVFFNLGDASDAFLVYVRGQ